MGYEIRGQVALLCCLSTTATVLEVEMLRHYLVDRVDPLHSVIPPQMAIILPLTAVVLFIVDMFFAARVYFLKQVHMIVVTFIVFTATVCMICGIVTTVEVFMNPVTEIVSKRSVTIEIGITNVTSAVSELSAALALCWSLMTVRTGVQSTDSILQKLFKWSMSRGLFLTIVQVVALIVYVVNTEALTWLPFEMALNKVYIMTMMSMLNSRPELRRDFVKASSALRSGDNVESTGNYYWTTPAQIRTEYELSTFQSISVSTTESTIEVKDTITQDDHKRHTPEIV
ncbi:hypothetical protein D9758_015540 [Tetrapyrgos nigripes]|uniref:DUF6534 domain-containing protein n=1 Tax=Tetrapyrgos nigripes TaxID=182062 RepID=A0A8H5FEX1_9AGAR|nr:hypothetical protein D9758_015540 [Tetrapyrgos nigripes]